MFRRRIVSICGGFLGFATNTYKNSVRSVPQSARDVIILTHLEHVESLKLDVLALISQEVHHHLEVCFVGDILGHDVEVGSVKEDLPQQLERLPLCDIIVGQDECC